MLVFISGAVGGFAILTTATVLTGGVALLAAGVIVGATVGGTMIGAAASCFDDGLGNLMDFQGKIPEQPSLRMKTQKLRI